MPQTAREQACEFYERGLSALAGANVPHLVGGGYAFAHYTGIHRPLKDLDVFVCAGDLDRALAVLATVADRTEVTFPHWLGKAFHGDHLIDVIHSSGNGLAAVDHEWFSFAPEVTVLNQRVRLIPAEEMIWSKAFVIERERCDVTDVIHLLLRAGRLDWDRLLRRFGPHYRVLYAQIVLFGFAYPSERTAIPRRVFERLSRALADEQQEPDARRICQGTLLSRAQFLAAITEWGYQDARLEADVHMTGEQIAQWTEAIPEEIRSDDYLEHHHPTGRAR